MSYRTYVNDNQIFGNNEYYPEWIEFIKSKGIVVGEDGQYAGTIDDFMGALEVCERIVLRINNEKKAHKRQSLFDLSYIEEKINDTEEKKYPFTLFEELYNLTENGYLFIPNVFF